MRPMVKPPHAPFRMAGNRIRIGGTVYGIAADIHDPTGRVWALLQAMTGDATSQEVVAAVAAQFPGAHPAVIQADLDTLIARGYVTDTAAPDPPGITGKARHTRTATLFQWMDRTPLAGPWEFLAALQRARVTVVGLGGTGGHAALEMALSGVGELRCIDPDVVEFSNLNRQILYGEADVGRPKAAAAAEQLLARNSSIEVTGERARVTGPGDAQELAAGCDVVVLAADEPPELRRWVNRACLAAGIPWVDAGYHGPLIQAGVFLPGKGACWECVAGTCGEYRANVLGAEPDQSAPVHASAAHTAGLSGSLAAHYALAVITGVPAIKTSEVTHWNLMDLGASWTTRDPARENCPACSPVAVAR